MKLIDALNTLRDIPPDTESSVIHLACGFTPLHLKTLLAAEIWRLSRRKADIKTGLYGDLLESLRRGGESDAGFVICAAEWSDFDPRLGLRNLGGWSPVVYSDVSATVNARMAELERSIQEVSARVPVALSTPTLPLPPISFTSAEQASALELELRACVDSSAARLSRLPNVRVLNSNHATLVEAGGRLDVKSDLLTGFPYSMSHAAAMASILARLISDLPPKKGLITDLDDTLWKGLVGEVGADGISWTLDGKAQIHGLYQQFLGALGGAGVLLGVASKNDPRVVDAAFARADLMLSKDQLFPIEVSWEPKSRSVGRILHAWNISADSVVLVDDSPTELAEVAAAHPGIECFQFPTHDWQAAYHLLEKLRDRFGKRRLLEEDLLRSQSLRSPAADFSLSALPSYERFLDEAKPEFSVQYCDSTPDPRALELINKTNQFNLNGKRHTHASLLRYLKTSGGFIMVASYKDKYGPLGKVAVVCGFRQANAVRIETWVMSCRAFSRRIEHRCLEELFHRFTADQVTFDFQQTERNAPLEEFLTAVLGRRPFPGCRLARSDSPCRNSRPDQTLPEALYA